MHLEFYCPECKQLLRVSNQAFGQEIKYSKCGSEIQLPKGAYEQEDQPSKAEADDVQPKSSDTTQHNRKAVDGTSPLKNIADHDICGIMGVVILFVGVFTPIVSAPIVGGQNYFQNGKGGGAIDGKLGDVPR